MVTIFFAAGKGGGFQPQPYELVNRRIRNFLPHGNVIGITFPASDMETSRLLAQARSGSVSQRLLYGPESTRARVLA